MAWFPQYVNADAFATLREDWGANVVCLAMHTAESGGYCTDGDQAALLALVGAGGPAFVSECGITDASGSGHIDGNSAAAWLNLLNSRNVSFVAWSLSNKNETSALIAPGVQATSGWAEADLADAGRWFKEAHRKLMRTSKLGQGAFACDQTRPALTVSHLRRYNHQHDQAEGKDSHRARHQRLGARAENRRSISRGRLYRYVRQEKRSRLRENC